MLADKVYNYALKHNHKLWNKREFWKL
jgi:hypothetical protein